MLHPASLGRRPVRWLSALALLASLLVSAVPASAQTATPGWNPGPGAVGDNTFDGFIDWPQAGASIATNVGFTLNGWVVDKSAQGWAGIDDAHLYDGLAGQGGVFLGKGSIAGDRPDVGMVLGNPFWSPSGFAFTVAGSQLSVGPHTLTVYAHTPSRGWWYRQVAINVTAASYTHEPLVAITAPTAGDDVPTNKDYTITGWAIDRNATPAQGTGVDRVEVWFGAERDAAGAIFLGEADRGFESGPAAVYGTQFVDAGWQLTFSPTKFHEDYYFIYVYAHSRVSGKETVTSLQFHIKEST